MFRLQEHWACKEQYRNCQMMDLSWGRNQSQWDNLQQCHNLRMRNKPNNLIVTVLLDTSPLRFLTLISCEETEEGIVGNGQITELSSIPG